MRSNDDGTLFFDPNDGQKVHRVMLNVITRVHHELESIRIDELMSDLRYDRPKLRLIQISRSIHDQIFSRCLNEFRIQVDLVFVVLDHESFSSSIDAPSWNEAISILIEFMRLTIRTRDSIISFFDHINPTRFQKSKSSGGDLKIDDNNEADEGDEIIFIPIKRFNRTLRRLDRLIGLWKELIITYKAHLYAIRTIPADTSPLVMFHWDRITYLKQDCIEKSGRLITMNLDIFRPEYLLNELRSTRRAVEGSIKNLSRISCFFENNQSSSIGPMNDLEFQNHHSGDDEEIGEDEEDYYEEQEEEDIHDDDDDDDDDDYSDEFDIYNHDSESYSYSPLEKDWIRFGVKLLIILNLFLKKVLPNSSFHHRLKIFDSDRSGSDDDDNSSRRGGRRCKFLFLSDPQVLDLIEELQVWSNLGRSLNRSLSSRPIFNRTKLVKVLNGFSRSIERVFKIIFLERSSDDQNDEIDHGNNYPSHDNDSVHDHESTHNYGNSHNHQTNDCDQSSRSNPCYSTHHHHNFSIDHNRNHRNCERSQKHDCPNNNSTDDKSLVSSPIKRFSCLSCSPSHYIESMCNNSSSLINRFDKLQLDSRMRSDRRVTANNSEGGGTSMVKKKGREGSLARVIRLDEDDEEWIKIWIEQVFKIVKNFDRITK